MSLLRNWLDEGLLLLCGPKALSKGGFVIVKGKNISDIENYFYNDPLHTSCVTIFKITEFKLLYSQSMFLDWFN